ncbi:MAG: branched-chain amino acid ABC transporter permease LivH [Alphaproteobacteria bacterium]|nr:MAG: branched-chain amino acid ABC transporter permease LivH [Alphaproteobacteria bacterium]
MEYFLQQLINGLTLGSIYALIAIGYTMVYGIIGMINFAHGDIYMIGAFIALVSFLFFSPMIASFAVLLLIVLICSIFFTACYGFAVERVAYKRLRGSFRLAPLISAIGMSMFLQNYVQVMQGARVKTLPPQLNGTIQLLQSDEFTVSISYIQLLIMGMTAVLLYLFNRAIRSTTLGKRQRAVEQDATMAAMLGISVDRTIAITFIMGAGLAAIAGTMVTLYYGVIDFYIGFLAGVKAFTAAVLGGIGSLPGAVLGGIVIGLIESLLSAYFSIEYKDVAVFATLIIVLLIKPTGFFGKPEVEKV